MACDCYEKIDAGLAEHNTRLTGKKLDRSYMLPIIATERIQNFRDGKHPLLMIPDYCPFCGTRYEPETPKILED